MTLLALLAFASALPLVECKVDSPSALAVHLHKDAYTFYVDADAARPYVSDSLHTLIARDNACEEVCAIEADPWIEAQDGETGGKISTEIKLNSPAQADVKLCYDFKMGDEPAPRQCATLRAVTDANGCWVADDLIGPNGTSLRSLYEAFDYD